VVLIVGVLLVSVAWPDMLTWMHGGRGCESANLDQRPSFDFLLSAFESVGLLPIEKSTSVTRALRPSAALFSFAILNGYRLERKYRARPGIPATLPLAVACRLGRYLGSTLVFSYALVCQLSRTLLF
jgi:hypothetical protein